MALFAHLDNNRERDRARSPGKYQSYCTTRNRCAPYTRKTSGSVLSISIGGSSVVTFYHFLLSLQPLVPGRMDTGVRAQAGAMLCETTRYKCSQAVRSDYPQQPSLFTIAKLVQFSSVSPNMPLKSSFKNLKETFVRGLDELSATGTKPLFHTRPT